MIIGRKLGKGITNKIQLKCEKCNAEVLTKRYFQ